MAPHDPTPGSAPEGSERLRLELDILASELGEGEAPEPDDGDDTPAPAEDDDAPEGS